MIAYVDASVLLRQVLRQPNRLETWNRLETGVVSSLVEVECLRTLDRLRLQQGVPAAELATRREALYRLLEPLDVVEITRPVLRRASESFAVPLGSLDAIHLSTALLWQEWSGQTLAFATHDAALALASRSHGLTTIGA